MSVDRIIINGNGSETEVTVGRAVDVVARTVAEAEETSWAVASRDDRDRFMNIADAVVKRHFPKVDPHA